jgi:Na+-driven multidrug efflux pump
MLPFFHHHECRCLGVGQLGVIPLAIHTIPTQVVTLGYLIPQSIGTALSTRLGTLLPQDVRLSKQLVIWSFVACSILFGAMSLALFAFRGIIIRILVLEDEVIEGCERIWWKVCVNFFLWCVFGFNEAIAVALGLQWTLGWLTIVIMWIFALPCTWYFGIVKYQSIDVVWSWLIAPYAIMDVALMVSFICQDWDKISEEIREREEMDESSDEDESESEDEEPTSSNNGVAETTYLLGANGIGKTA